MSRKSDRADALFNTKELRQREGQKAKADYEADQRAEREKTVKLRALRLARDALSSEASGLRVDSMVRAHSASEDPRKRAGDTRPKRGSSARDAAAEQTPVPPAKKRSPDSSGTNR